ncbi:hypothetical protein B0H13DRAFT_2322886 [Mycena leptocephala]|nr:hypothetical protein B0H13DRAFT_2322886 [Mycena leptocephala]
MAHQQQNVPWHAGLEYQVCDCGYFAWMDPELFNAAERRHANSPANGAPSFPPPDYPDDLGLPLHTSPVLLPTLIPLSSNRLIPRHAAHRIPTHETQV